MLRCYFRHAAFTPLMAFASYAMLFFIDAYIAAYASPLFFFRHY